jgi:hypothetical protein
MGSKAIEDLATVPNIVGSLGLAIADAQKAFNLEYLSSLERLVALSSSLLSGRSDAAGQPALGGTAKESFDASADVLRDLLIKLAPPRYQFTETTLSVRLDLAQSLKGSATVGLGVGVGAVAVNAALSVGYGYDYRAAAECRTTIHAVLPDPTALQTLLGRAKELADKPIELPPRAAVDTELVTKSQAIYERLVGVKPPAVTEKAPT